MNVKKIIMLSSKFIYFLNDLEKDYYRIENGTGDEQNRHISNMKTNN